MAVNIHRPGSRALLHIRQPIVLISSRRDRRIRRRGSLDVHSSYFLGRKFYRAAPIFEVKARSDQEPIVARNEKGDGNSRDQACLRKPEIAILRRASPKACDLADDLPQRHFSVICAAGRTACRSNRTGRHHRGHSRLSLRAGRDANEAAARAGGCGPKELRRAEEIARRASCRYWAIAASPRRSSP